MRARYSWKYERVTVEWPIRFWWWFRATGVIRVHNDKDKIPGDYHCAGTIVVKWGKYEVMGFVTKDRRPDTSEFREFYRYLESLGLKKYRHVRAKQGEVVEVKCS